MAQRAFEVLYIQVIYCHLLFLFSIMYTKQNKTMEFRVEFHKFQKMEQKQQLKKNPGGSKL